MLRRNLPWIYAIVAGAFVFALVMVSPAVVGDVIIFAYVSLATLFAALQVRKHHLRVAFPFLVSNVKSLKVLRRTGMFFVIFFIFWLPVSIVATPWLSPDAHVYFSVIPTLVGVPVGVGMLAFQGILRTYKALGLVPDDDDGGTRMP